MNDLRSLSPKEKIQLGMSGAHLIRPRQGVDNAPSVTRTSNSGREPNS